jgi:hypothetical protein
MNCDDYREAVSADPDFAGGAGHLAGCADCRAYRDEMLQLDDRIARALMIDVPPLSMPDLAEVPADKVVRLHTRRGVPVRTWFAVAASVLVAVLLGVRMLSPGIGYESLADEVLAHVSHEAFAMRVTDRRVPDDRLRAVVAADVAAFDQGTALISYAQTCVINGRSVPHLVMQGRHGPVMILLMPDEKIAAAIPLSDEDMHGVILPVGDGSVAILGPRGEPLGDIEETVVKSVTWKT